MRFSTEQIELGNVTGQEFASSMGRVTATAAELGVGLDEVLAAYSSLTIGGVKASEASTQIRQSMVSLIKPSEDLQAAFREIGVASGEQLIASKGFIGAIDAVLNTTNGAKSETAELFRNIRALSGVFRLSGTGAAVYTKSLQAIQAANGELVDQKLADYFDTTAARVSAAANQISNAVRVDIGESFTIAAERALQLVGGADNVSSVLVAGAPAAAKAAAAVGVYGVAVGTAALSQRLFNRQLDESLTKTQLLGRALGAVTAVAAGAAIAGGVGEATGDYLSKIFTDDYVAAATEAKKAQAEAASVADEVLAKQRESIKTANQARQTEVNNLRAIYTAELDIVTAANQAMLDSDSRTLDAVIKGRQQFVSDLRKAADDAANATSRTAALEARLDDERFENQLSNLSKLEKVQQQLSRARQLAEGGEFGRAESFARQAEQAAKGTSQQAEAQRTVESILRQQLDAERALAAERAKSAKDLTAQANAEERRLQTLKAAAATFKANAVDDPSKARGALQTLQGLGVELQTSPASLDRLAQAVQGSLDQRAFIAKIVPDVSGLSFPQQLDKANQQLDKQAKVSQGLAELTRQRSAAETAIVEQTKLATASYNEQASAAKAILAAASAIPDFLAGRDPAADAQRIGALRAETQQLLASTTLTTEQVDALAAKFNDLQGEGLAGSAQVLLSKAAAEFESLRQVAAVRASIEAGTTAELQQQAAAAERIAAATERTAAAGGGAQGLALGGIARRYAGGGVAGTDRIPAMLSAGETVVPKAQSQRFFSELAAIRGGIAPRQYAEGGTVGDTTWNVSVDVHNPGGPAMTGQAIARELQRATRTGRAR